MLFCYIDSSLLCRGLCCFNGCIIKANEDSYSFFFRVNKTIQNWFDSKIYVVNIPVSVIEASRFTYLLTNRQFKLKPPSLVISHGEDPRVIQLPQDELLISYNVVPTKENLSCDVHASILREDKPQKTLTFPALNALKVKQKNWTFFVHHDSRVLLLYSLMPTFEIYDLEENLIISEEWRHPLARELEIRGGAPPIRVGSEYWVFAHSKGYRIFVYTFCAETLRPRRVSSRPLLLHGNNSRKIHFPCGAVLDHRDKIVVSCGVNDHMSALLHTSVKEVNSMLIEKR